MCTIQNGRDAVEFLRGKALLGHVNNGIEIILCNAYRPPIVEVRLVGPNGGRTSIMRLGMRRSRFETARVEYLARRAHGAGTKAMIR